MPELDHFVSAEFYRFKAFENFSIQLRRFNVLVGPNNAGKSTILAAFRILSAAIRRAESRKAEWIPGPEGRVSGHKIDLSSISVAEENLFFNYDEDEPAYIRFRLSSGNILTLYFPEREVCFLIPDAQGRPCSTPATFKTNFRCPIGFVPILGPVEHREPLYDREAARLALFNYGAARNFRNIWYHYPDGFDEFRELVMKTWPGMDVMRPELDRSYARVRLHMLCPENRRPREIFWAGFGFQVWCQMLTHVIQSRGMALFLIDEPDIYLHSDLQRQLLGILRNLGPDILIATHSTEIITECEIDDIVIIDKRRRRSSRIRRAGQLEEVFRALGSAVNPILTQLAKTRRVIFVEGADFQLFARFARKLGVDRIGYRSDFAVVPTEGFNPERIRNLKAGMEATLGTPVAAAAILDRDYRSDRECAQIIAGCGNFCDLAVIHDCKEIENFLLVPEAIDRAAEARLNDKARRGGLTLPYEPIAGPTLQAFAEEKRHYVTSQCLASRRRYERGASSAAVEETLVQSELGNIERRWGDAQERLRMIPGKEALGCVNQVLQDRFGVSITPTAVIEAMHVGEVPSEMSLLILKLDGFARGVLAQ
jgi:energy-coupling factor transporter ATP-binding protein EcfA2